MKTKTQKELEKLAELCLENATNPKIEKFTDDDLGNAKYILAHIQAYTVSKGKKRGGDIIKQKPTHYWKGKDK